MNPKTLETFRRDLIERGRSMVRRRKQALADEEQLLTEREPDWEDQAADESAAAVLDRLGETERTELARIKASLERIDRGTYGACTACGGWIDLARLRAVPEADRCAGCMDPR
jgi:RNA polymerase-binding protein DksA